MPSSGGKSIWSLLQPSPSRPSSACSGHGGARYTRGRCEKLKLKKVVFLNYRKPPPSSCWPHPQMTLVPTTLSLACSFISAITMLGTPSEMYAHGTQYWVIGLSYPLVLAATAHLYLSVFHRLQFCSVHEYLEKRFNKSVRTFAAGVSPCLSQSPNFHVVWTIMDLTETVQLWRRSLAVLEVSVWITCYISSLYIWHLSRVRCTVARHCRAQHDVNKK